jgi:hypothetical protein
VQTKKKEKYLDQRERAWHREESHLLQNLQEAALVAGHHQVGGHVHQLVQVGGVVVWRRGEKGLKMGRGHPWRPETTDKSLNLGRAPELGKDKDQGLRGRRHVVSDLVQNG